MKKVLIAGVASAAFAAMPLAGVFAVDNIVDTIQVTVNESCTFTRSTTTGTLGTGGGADANTISKSMSMNTADQNFGSTTLRANCNYPKGYKIKGTFTALTNTSNSGATIPYTNDAVTAGTAGWTAVKGASTSTTYLTSGADGNVASTTAADTANNDVQITYKVATSTTQAAGTYTGTATYALTKNN